MTVLADGTDLLSIQKLEPSLSLCMAGVAGNARCLDGPVFVNGVVGVSAPLGSFLFLHRPSEDRVVALFALLVPEREAHPLRLAVMPHEEANGIEAGPGQNLKPLRKVCPAVAINTAERRLGVVVDAGQVFGGRRTKLAKLFLVEMAGDTEAVVPILLDEGP
jgi:hypothetical protein